MGSGGLDEGVIGRIVDDFSGIFGRGFGFVAGAGVGPERNESEFRANGKDPKYLTWLLQ